MSSWRSRKFRENRQYHLTQVVITIGSNFRLRNSGGRQDLIEPNYQIRKCILPEGPFDDRMYSRINPQLAASYFLSNCLMCLITARMSSSLSFSPSGGIFPLPFFTDFARSEPLRS